MPMLEGPLNLNDTFATMVKTTLASCSQEEVWDQKTRELIRPRARQNVQFHLRARYELLCEQEMHTFREELQVATYAVAAAISNPIQVDMAIERYAQKGKPKKAKARIGVVDNFSVVVDRDFKIVAWVLPGIILPTRVKAYNEACIKMKGLLEKRLCSAKGSAKERKSIQWQGFRVKPVLGAGRVTLSPGYFMVGHTGPNHQLKKSADVQTPECQQWLLDVQETEALMGAIALILCPAMTRNGATIVDRIRDERLAGDPLPIWPSPFNCIEILANRASVPHRDSGGGWSMHDLLASFGFDHDAVLTIMDLGATIPFPPGSLITLLSKVFEHSATWTKGERICVPHFMKDEVHEYLQQPIPALPDLGDYLSMIGCPPRKCRKRKRSGDHQFVR